jgi:hypothetical protein
MIKEMIYVKTLKPAKTDDWQISDRIESLILSDRNVVVNLKINSTYSLNSWR